MKQGILSFTRSSSIWYLAFSSFQRLAIPLSTRSIKKRTIIKMIFSFFSYANLERPRCSFNPESTALKRLPSSLRLRCLPTKYGYYCTYRGGRSTNQSLFCLVELFWVWRGLERKKLASRLLGLCSVEDFHKYWKAPSAGCCPTRRSRRGDPHSDQNELAPRLFEPVSLVKRYQIASSTAIKIKTYERTMPSMKGTTWRSADA